MRKLLLLAILLSCAATAHGQATYDCFGGLLTYSDGSAAPTISGHPDVQNATISQSGTTQTAVVTDATKYAVNEPMFIKGTSTAMDYACDTARSDAGASIITVVNTGTNTLTMTAPASRTQSSVSGTVTPAHEWVPGSPVLLGGKLRIPFVTPLDHWRFKEEVGAACANHSGSDKCPNFSASVFASKYGSSSCTMAADVYAQLKVINFNGISNNPDGDYDPTANGSCSNAKAPFSQEQFLSQYASVDLGGYATQPLINTTYGLTVTLNGPKRALLDYYNPQFQPFMTSFLSTFNTSFTSFAKSPWFGMVTVDDTGNVALTNATWNFHTNGLVGKNDNNPAYQILVSAPLQAGNNTNNAIYGGGPAKPYLYKDPTVYSKTPCSYNPYGTSTTCGTPNCFNSGTICRLADFLCCNGTSLYNSLAAFNAAWGTAYTTMGSSETPHLAETVATGNGATTVFTGTLANSNVTPVSVQLYLTPSGGSPVFFGFGCWNSLINCGGSAGQSIWKSAGSFVGQTAYALHYPITDSNGDIEEVTTAGTTASSAPSWPAAGSCTGTQTTVSGSATFTCRGSSVSAGNVVDSTGVFTLTTNNALATGATISVNYTTGGWKASTPGTGFADETGSNTAIFGTNSVCIKILPDWTAATNYGYAFNQPYEIHTSGTWQIVLQPGTSGGSAPTFSTTAGTDVTDGTVIWESVGKPVCGTEGGSDFGVANMNQTVAADLDKWLIQFASQYLKSVRTAVKTLAPHMLYQGPDQCGVWFNPCRREVALAMQSYSDVYYTTLADPSFDPNGTAKYRFITADYNGPIYLYTTYASMQSVNNPAANCKDNYPCSLTLSERGNRWFNLLNWSINQTPGLSGNYQMAGLLHWGTHNFQTNSPFGLRTDLDNQYDGLEDVVLTPACSAPLSLLTCGGESALANFLGANGLTATHSYKDANALWTLAPQNVTVPAVQISLLGQAQMTGTHKTR